MPTKEIDTKEAKEEITLLDTLRKRGQEEVNSLQAQLSATLSAIKTAETERIRILDDVERQRKEFGRLIETQKKVQVETEELRHSLDGMRVNLEKQLGERERRAIEAEKKALAAEERATKIDSTARQAVAKSHDLLIRASAAKEKIATTLADTVRKILAEILEGS